MLSGIYISGMGYAHATYNFYTYVYYQEWIKKSTELVYVSMAPRLRDGHVIKRSRSCEYLPSVCTCENYLVLTRCMNLIMSGLNTRCVFTQ